MPTFYTQRPAASRAATVAIDAALELECPEGGPDDLASQLRQRRGDPREGLPLVKRGEPVPQLEQVVDDVDVERGAPGA